MPGRLLLRPGAQASPAHSRGRQVCSCFDVTEPEIEAALADGAGAEAERLARVQAATRCGTNCGSCLPELKRLLRRSALAAA